MQSISVPSLPSSSCYPIPSHHLHFHNHNRLLHHRQIHVKEKSFLALSFARNQTHFPETHSLDLSTASSNFLYPVPDFAPFQQLHSKSGSDGASEQNPDPKSRDRRSEDRLETEDRFESEGRSMWWGDLKAAVGQRLNVEGVVAAAAVVLRDRRLLVPHVAVADIRCIDWVELRRRGFKGVVFDKDNTITVPYSLELWGPLGGSIEMCKSVFGDDIAVFSNSAGLFEYDRSGSKARQMEAAIGIRVIRHRLKKPAGSAEEVEEHFGCDSSQLIMVGDRLFTDIVYGNRNGFLTILTEPLSLKEEPFIVRQVRKLETSLLKHWIGRGSKPTGHSLLLDPTRCVKDPPLP